VSGPVVIQDGIRFGETSAVRDQRAGDLVDHRLCPDTLLGQGTAERRGPLRAPRDGVALAELQKAVELRADARKMHADVAHLRPLHVHYLASISLPSRGHLWDTSRPESVNPDAFANLTRVMHGVRIMSLVTVRTSRPPRPPCPASVPRGAVAVPFGQLIPVGVFRPSSRS
jgi:hypothetical protein